MTVVPVSPRWRAGRQTDAQARRFMLGRSCGSPLMVPFLPEFASWVALVPFIPDNIFCVLLPLFFRLITEISTPACIPERRPVNAGIFFKMVH